jgi:hypothetical protein
VSQGEVARPGVETSLRRRQPPGLSQRLAAGLLVGVFLLMIAIPVPADWLLTELDVPLPRLAPVRVGKIRPADYFNGTAAQKLEKQSLNESHVARWLTPRHSELVYLLLRRAAPASWLGRDKWLFIPDRVRERRQEHWDYVIGYNADAIEKVNQLVTSRGAELVVALVPNRSRVYPDKAYRWGGKMPPGKAAFLPGLAVELRRRNIAAVDLTGALIKERERGRVVFFPDDHHWTAIGAQAAARAIIAEMPESHRALLIPTERKPRYRVSLRPRATSEHSLVRKLGFRPGGKLRRRFFARGSKVKFSGQDAVGFARCCASYWSTSYGRFGSPKFFANEALCPVRIMYRDGAGSGRIPVEEMRRLPPTRNLKGKHLFVWEIPEYHLSDGSPDNPSTLTGVHQYFEGRDPEWTGSE